MAHKRQGYGLCVVCHKVKGHGEICSPCYKIRIATAMLIAPEALCLKCGSPFGKHTICQSCGGGCWWRHVGKMYAPNPNWFG